MARIVVTRPAGREKELVERLRRAGHEVVHVPLIAVEPVGDEPIDVTGYDWVVLTSVAGARELRRRMRGSPARVAAIGRATAAAFGGELGAAYLGTQGDVWDAHKDMALAGLGALVAMIVTAALNARLQRDFAREWAQSLRAKDADPAG